MASAALPMPTTRHPIRRAEFNIHEKSYAGYAQANFKFDLGGDASVDGIVGIRGVRTEEDIRGFSRHGQSAVATPVDYRNRYWDWLPNANLNVHFRPQLAVAAGGDADTHAADLPATQSGLGRSRLRSSAAIPP